MDVGFLVERDAGMFGGLLERAWRLYRCLVEVEAPPYATLVSDEDQRSI